MKVFFSVRNSSSLKVKHIGKILNDSEKKGTIFKTVQYLPASF